VFTARRSVKTTLTRASLRCRSTLRCRVKPSASPSFGHALPFGTGRTHERRRRGAPLIDAERSPFLAARGRKGIAPTDHPSLVYGARARRQLKRRARPRHNDSAAGVSDRSRRFPRVQCALMRAFRLDNKHSVPAANAAVVHVSVVPTRVTRFLPIPCNSPHHVSIPCPLTRTPLV